MQGSPIWVKWQVAMTKFPLTGNYACLRDSSGLTDVRVWDHQAKTLRVGVWLHRLDMALSGKPATSGSLVQARQQRSPIRISLGPWDH